MDGQTDDRLTPIADHIIICTVKFSTMAISFRQDKHQDVAFYGQVTVLWPCEAKDRRQTKCINIKQLADKLRDWNV